MPFLVIRWQYVALVLLGLSYLNPNSFLPWPNFGQDFFAIFALFLLFSSSFSKKIKINLNISLIYALILITIIIQYFFGLYYFHQDLIMFVLYIFLFYISITLGLNRVINIFNFIYLFTIVGVVSVTLQILQWFGIESLFIREFYGNRPYANLGQPNQLATLLFFSFFSTIYLFLNNKVSFIVYWLISIFITFGIVLASSRTSWVVFFIIIMLSLFKDKKIFKIILVNFIIYMLQMTIVILSLNLRDTSNQIHGVVQDSRLKIWGQLLNAIQHNPWLGYGVNQTSIAQTKVSFTHPSVVWVEYSHSVVIDFLLWFGLPIGLILIAVISIFICKRIKSSYNNELIVLYIIISFLVHSLLEFPFAYAYFIIPIGFFLGLLINYQSDKNFFLNKKVIVISYFIFLGFSLMLLRDYFLFKNYSKEVSFLSVSDLKSKPINHKVLILDVLYYNKLNEVSERCFLLKTQNLDYMEYMYYRYPNKINESLLLSKYIKERSFTDININNLILSLTREELVVKNFRNKQCGFNTNP